MRISCCKIGGGIIVGFVEWLVGWFIGGLVDWFFGGVVVVFAGGLVGWFVGGLIVVIFVGGIVGMFGMNPPLIDGILNVLPYELVSYKGFEKPKKWSMYSSNWKIFCELYKSIP